MALFMIFAYLFEGHITQDMTKESTGIVVQVVTGRSGFAYVAHYINNNRYVGRLSNMSYGRLREGMQIRIYYDPTDPRQLRSDNSIAMVLLWTSLFLFLLIGGIDTMKKGLIERRELNV